MAIPGSEAWRMDAITNAEKCGHFWCCRKGKAYSTALHACCHGEECDAIPGSDAWQEDIAVPGAHRCGSFLCCAPGLDFSQRLQATQRLLCSLSDAEWVFTPLARIFRSSSASH